ncbi:hypothetical protein [Brevundimonas sp. NPDC046655]|uniref:hypothetical protein n=1 Tax=unclassified Brevundimonas TaxID=2622653 RepID=UPI00384F4B11
MSAAWIALPATVCVGLVVMMWRRLITPGRFAQYAGGLGFGTLLIAAANGAFGGGHG